MGRMAGDDRSHRISNCPAGASRPTSSRCFSMPAVGPPLPRPRGTSTKTANPATSSSKRKKRSKNNKTTPSKDHICHQPSSGSSQLAAVHASSAPPPSPLPSPSVPPGSIHPSSASSSSFASAYSSSSAFQLVPVPLLRAPSPKAPVFTASAQQNSSIPLLSSSSSCFNTLPRTNRPAGSSGRVPPARPPLPAQLLIRADTLSKPNDDGQLLVGRNAAGGPIATATSTKTTMKTTTTTTSRSVCLPPVGQQAHQRLLLWPNTAVGGQQLGDLPTPPQLHVSSTTTTLGAIAVELIPGPLPPFSTEHQQQRASNGDGISSPARQLFDSLKHSARMACCFCCCPVYRCVLWFCVLELIFSLYFWYYELSELIRTYSTVELKDVLFLLILTGWLVTLCVSTVSLVMAQRKQDSQWILPRLIQQSGLLVLGFLMALVLVVYFAGAAQSINNMLISIYEHIYSDTIARESRQGVHEDLRFYALFGILADFGFICYVSSALCATKKFYREMQFSGGGRHFQPVTQYDPTAPPPQPPVNPHYRGSRA